MIIDQLPSIGTVQSTDEIPIERGTTTYKTTVDGLGKVSRAGDTMTGNLTLKSSTYEDGGDPPSTEQQGTRIRFYDKNNTEVGRFTMDFMPGGAQRMLLNAYRLGVQHFLTIGFNSSGNPSISSNHVEAWLSMLGLGTSGVLPVTIAQGGTGAATVNDARDNLGIPSSLTFSTFQLNGNSSRTIQIPNSTRGAVFVSGSAAGAKELIIFFSSSGGSVSYASFRDASNISCTTATNALTIANSSQYATTCFKITW